MEENDFIHYPVLVAEVLAALQVQPGKWYIDATAGGGGHASHILAAGGNVLALDQDEDAIRFLKKKFLQESKEKRIVIEQENFANISKVLGRIGSSEFHGILFDLGVSTYQIRQSGRGFSFQGSEPLDMRMSQQAEKNASDILNEYSEKALATLFVRFGEEVLGQKIAERIVKERKYSQLETTDQLVTIVRQVYKEARVKTAINPATKVFQALRIAVNEELTILQPVLQEVITLIQGKGRIAVISFHSLEDRIVKQVFQQAAQNNEVTVITKKPITVTDAEREKNPASRSAKLRVVEKRV